MWCPVETVIQYSDANPGRIDVFLAKLFDDKYGFHHTKKSHSCLYSAIRQHPIDGTVKQLDELMCMLRLLHSDEGNIVGVGSRIVLDIYLKKISIASRVQKIADLPFGNARAKAADENFERVQWIRLHFLDL